MANKSGFTLWEMLINLIIISLMLLLIVQIPAKKIKGSIEERLFIDQLTVQINYTQQKALLHNRGYTVIFDQNIQAVRFSDRILYLPENLHFNQTFIFDYLPNGRVNKFKTITFYNNIGSDIKIVFQLGSGKFVVQMEQ